MAKREIIVNRSGIGMGGALFLLFLTLKLTGVIAWSWLWVTAPIWIPVAIVGTVIMAGLFIAASAVLIENWRE